jgi:hypothetical protein
VQTGFGRREYQALSTCEFEASCGACRDLCGASGLCVLQSSPTSAPPPAAAISCGGCMREKCVAETKACEPGSDCAKYFACTNPCPEPRAKCVETCNAQNASGRAAAQALLDCSNNTCKGSCVF